LKLFERGQLAKQKTNHIIGKRPESHVRKLNSDGAYDYKGKERKMEIHDQISMGDVVKAGGGGLGQHQRAVVVVCLDKRLPSM
jgi:hypothetical protein